MVSQGQRLFEGLPKEESGAKEIICSKLSNDDSQKLFENTKNHVNTIDNQLVDNIDNFQNGRLYSCENQDSQVTFQDQGTQSESSDEMHYCENLFLQTKTAQCHTEGESTVNDKGSKLINTNHNLASDSVMIGMESDDLPHDDSPTKNNDARVVEHLPVMQEEEIPDHDNYQNFYITSEQSPLRETHINDREMLCGASQAVSSRRVLYSHGVSSEDPRVISNRLQMARKAPRLSLASESQLLLSGVPTIPEQLPLILTEGDAEEQESLTLAGAEQLQAISTHTVLGASQGSRGLMVFSSSDISPSGHLIPISGTNLLVLQSIDGQGQIIQPNSVIVAGQHQILPKPIEQMRQGKLNGKQYHCPHAGCTKIAPTSSKLKLHMLSHTGERPHKCPLEGCDWAFTTAYKLKRHIRGHTGERPYICEMDGCGKCFTTTYNLKTHQKAHIHQHDNICSFRDCSETFSTLHKLKIHEKKHLLDTELHLCNFTACGKQFKSLSNYNAHVKTHSGERHHACVFEGCEKRFTKASKLKLHVRTHTGERPFVCEEESCDWSFTSAYKLKRHMRKHTGERPFTCEFAECGRSFTRASHMRTHALSHTGQKPYICPLSDCLKGFTAASSLNIHMRKHAGDKPFKCNVEGCDKAYTTGANLRLHQKRHENKRLNLDDETIEKDKQVTSDHPSPVHYVEIGGVNSVVETDPNSAPATPYSVMQSFTGEDFATEDVASLTVVQFSSEETFPSQTSASTMDSAGGICFQFSSSDSYTNPTHSNTSSSLPGLSFHTGTPLPSPGTHYPQTNMTEEDVEPSGDLRTNTNEGQLCSHASPGETTPVSTGGEYIVREQPVCAEVTSGDKEDEDLTLPTMVVFTSQGVQPPGRSSSPIIPQTSETGRSEENRNSERNVRHLTLQQPCDTSSLEEFAPPAIIFQGEEVKAHVNIKDAERSDSNHCRAPESRRSSNLSCLPVQSNLSLNLSSLSDDIAKSPVSPFISVVGHSLDHESTINLQDLR